MNKIIVNDYTKKEVEFKPGDLFIDKNLNEIYLLTADSTIIKPMPVTHWALANIKNGWVLHSENNFDFKIPKALTDIIFLGRDLEININKK